MRLGVPPCGCAVITPASGILRRYRAEKATTGNAANPMQKRGPFRRSPTAAGMTPFSWLEGGMQKAERGSPVTLWLPSSDSSPPGGASPGAEKQDPASTMMAGPDGASTHEDTIRAARTLPIRSTGASTNSCPSDRVTAGGGESEVAGGGRRVSA